MDNIRIKPKKLKGEVMIPSSKSLGHRGIIASALSNNLCKIDNVNYSEDIMATIDVMRSLGAKIEAYEDSITVDGSNMFKNLNNKIELYCNESGSTLRFMIPIALTHKGNYEFTGRGKLVSRPLDPYYEIFEKQGIEYKNNEGELPLNVKGAIKSGIYNVRGDISSQFISGLLFSLPILEGNSEIVMTTKLESRGYVDLTIDVLKDFGIEIKNDNYKSFKINGGQSYKSSDFYIEGDYSQAAFFLVAGAIGSDICCQGLREDSLQGDKVIVDILKDMDCKIEVKDNYIKAIPSITKGIDVDVSECPDVVPVLTVLAGLSKGTTRIINAGRLRIKECDRLHAITEELNKIGANIIEYEDYLVIEGVDEYKGGIVNSHNDHRIVMALAMAATKSSGEVIIEDYMAISKSYPKFFEDYKTLGGDIFEFNNR